MAFSSICCSHIGFLSNISFTMPFQWNVLSTISLSKIFTWDVGEGPLQWYVVESTPISNINCDEIGCPAFACIKMTTSSRCSLNSPIPNQINSSDICSYELSRDGIIWTLSIDNNTDLWTFDIYSDSELAAQYTGTGGIAVIGASVILNLSINNDICSDLPDTVDIRLIPDQQYVQIDTIMATSVAHLCERLREQQYSRKIRKIKKWTKPALECDVQKDIQNGIDHCCNKLVEVDLCDCECAGYMINSPSTCSITQVANNSLVWYTEYINLTEPLVVEDQIVIRGQKLGYIAKPASSFPYLHWGVGDGQVGGNIGQTIDIDGVFNWPANGERAAVSPPNSTTFSDDEICYIKSTLISPVKQDCCDWEQLFDSVILSDYEYYAQDLNCMAPDEDLGMPVFVASGGCDVVSRVLSVQTVDGVWVVIVEHSKASSGGYEASFAMTRQIRTGFVDNKLTQVVADGFYAKPIEIIQPLVKALKVRGYNKPISNILKFSHNFKHLSGLKRIADKISEKVALNYSAITKSWQYSQHITIDGVHWSVMFSLANPEEAWMMQISVSNSVKGRNSLSKMKIGFKEVPNDKFSINMIYDLGVVSSNCKILSKFVHDDLKLFESEPLTLKVG